MANKIDILADVECGIPENENAISLCYLLLDDGSEEGIRLHSRSYSDGDFDIDQRYVDTGDSIDIKLEDGSFLTISKIEIATIVQDAIRENIGMFSCNNSDKLAASLRSDPELAHEMFQSALQDVYTERGLPPEDTANRPEEISNTLRKELPKRGISYLGVLGEIRKGSGVCAGCVLRAFCPIDRKIVHTK